jgi:transcriptional regulator with XRE-family HTH domain
MPTLHAPEKPAIPEVMMSTPKPEKPVAMKAIDAGLRPYAIGEKLRGLRLRKSMGLVQLGKHTGLSPAMLSKLERGRLFPTLPTLLRIAMVFSVGLDYFFTDERKRHIVALVRKKDRMRFPERPVGGEVSYFFESLDFTATERKLSAYYADFVNVPGDKLKGHQHPGVELIFMLKGQLELKIGSEEYCLQEGDSIYFDSAVRHSYRNPSKADSAAMVVTVP